MSPTPPMLRAAVVDADGPDLDSQIATLETALADLRRQRAARDDARWLRTLARAVQGHAFTTRELVDQARLDATLRELIGRLTGRQIGKRLAALEGRDVAGVRLVRVVEKCDGWIWELRIQ